MNLPRTMLYGAKSALILLVSLSEWQVNRITSMPDPTTTVAAAAGKEVVKRADPYLALLLKPSFELIGKELRSQIKQRIDEWKKQKKEENLAGHLQKVRKVLEKQPASSKKAGASIAAVECFEEWADGAQEIDPEDEVLSSMWQQILVEMANGEAVQKVLIDKLKTLTPLEARVLLRFSPSGRLWRHQKDDEERHHLNNLLSKQLVSADYTQVIAQILGIAVIVLVVSGVASGWQDYYRSASGVLLKDRFFSLLYSWQMIAAAALFIYSYWGLLLYRRGLTQWRLTWVGEKLVRFAKFKPEHATTD